MRDGPVSRKTFYCSLIVVRDGAQMELTVKIYAFNLLLISFAKHYILKIAVTSNVRIRFMYNAVLQNICFVLQFKSV